VAYRSFRPDEETVEEVKQKLQENNIDINQLVEWPEDHCPQEDRKRAKKVRGTESGEEKGTLLADVVAVKLIRNILYLLLIWHYIRVKSR
jgi:hypothetical protein